jgi:23S rRNA (cytidine1920-2'-O)/16S rRNA (cytidine1409-2'-O)-methyltransferase
MEKTNIRYVTPEDIGEPIEFASCDVSFISLTKILVPVRELLSDNAEMVCLIKPQFEAGREKVGKNGVVREASVQKEVIRNIVDFVKANGYEALGLDNSPIKGPEGNIEFLIHIRKSDNVSMEEPFSIDEVVNQAHDALDK